MSGTRVFSRGRFESIDNKPQIKPWKESGIGGAAVAVPRHVGQPRHCPEHSSDSTRTLGWNSSWLTR